MADQETYACPFCDFVDHDSYFLMQHVELIHPEFGDSPFIAKDTDDVVQAPTGSSDAAEETTESASHGMPSLGSGVVYVQCPYDCGEQVSAAEISVHTDFHVAERMAFDEADAAPSRVELSTGPCDDEQSLKNISNQFTTDLPRSLRNYQQLSSSKRPSSDNRRSWSFKDFLLGSPNLPQRHAVQKTLVTEKSRPTRLGKAELGPYADEKQMPTWLRRMLEEGAEITICNQIAPNGSLMRIEAIANETPDLVPVLARLSDLDESVERAFYCSPEVRHVVKMHREGGFCGYRNIQMLISYIRGASAEGHEHFEGKIPSILKLQDIIEQAWEMGFNATGRIETGGVRGTRKYIGTPEAQALFLGLCIPCEANAFSTSDDLPGYKALLLAIGEYFSDDDAINLDQKLHMTSQPPIYFQHQGHSITIVGIEVRKNQSINLVVFDPMFKPSAALLRLKNSSSFRTSQPDRHLKAHRRGASYLSKYKDFEILKY